jgi:hypothetical protein
MYHIQEKATKTSPRRGFNDMALKWTVRGQCVGLKAECFFANKPDKDLKKLTNPGEKFMPQNLLQS